MGWGTGLTRGDGWPFHAPVRWMGLRGTITLSFALGGLLITVLLSSSTYLVARNVLLSQRESSVLAQAYSQASYLRDGLRGDRSVSQLLSEATPPAGSAAFVRRSEDWYATSLTSASTTIPTNVTTAVVGGDAMISWTETNGHADLVVGIPLHTVNAEYYLVTSTEDLERTLETLARASIIATVLAVIASATLGRWAASQVLRPLDDVASAAARIAGGDLKTRLPKAAAPELVTITTSFNAMVDALSARIERDARFSADVSHELRSPLTTLTTAVQLLQAKRQELPKRSQRALDLMSVELTRFRSVLEGLLELGRLDAGVSGTARQFADLGELVQHSLVTSGRACTPVEGLEHTAMVRVDKRQIDRALVNLFDNADIHGDGIALVELCRAPEEGNVCVRVHDRGEGIDPKDRERIFERFARGSHSRGSRPGSGLGLSLVAEMTRAHGGSVTAGDSPLGGAQFTLTLPITEPDPEPEEETSAADLEPRTAGHGADPQESGPALPPRQERP